MAAAELPDPAAKLELAWLLGAWYVLFSNRSEWRTRTHPRVEHDLLEPEPGERARMLITTRFRSPDLLGRAKHRLAVATAIAEPGGPPGLFLVHGEGLTRVSSSRRSFPIVDPDRRWAAVWHGRSSFGAAAGLDIYTRDPWIPQTQLDAMLAELRAHPFMGQRCAGLSSTMQDWFPPERYRLGE